MHPEFKKELKESDVVEITKFCLSADYFALEQSIGFAQILYKSDINYFLLKDESRILSFCQIYENFRTAHIWYGPVCNDREYIVQSLEEIIRHYRRRGFWYLGVQMYLKTGFNSDFVEYKLNGKYKIRYSFNNSNTKASLEIDLTQPVGVIYSGFRKGHKSDIKKAVKSGILVECGDSEQAIETFAGIYRKMCEVRHIGGHTAKEIKQIADYLHNHKQGQLLIAREADGRMIGGAIFAYQGISVRYLISASDPDIRDLPVSHLVLFRAIEIAKEAGFRYFDLWGYNHFAGKDDQIYLVNRFKKGFGGYFTFFAKKMNINLVPGGYNIYRLFVVMKKLWGKFPKWRTLIL